MKLYEATDDASRGLTHRRVSQNGLIEVGIFRVLYGFRVRAGFSNNPFGVELDWCGGSDWSRVEFLYSILIAILLNREESSSAFENLPLHSKIKPYHKDAEFMAAICGAVGGTGEIPWVSLSPPEIRLSCAEHTLASILDKGSLDGV